MGKTVITAKSDSIWKYFAEIWRYRSLIKVFCVRDLKAKYAQTTIGLAWTILQPLTSLIIFTFFFGYLLGWQAEGLPYPLYVLSGLLGWSLFNYIVYQGTGSIRESGNVIKKIYFPKAILPLSKVCVALIELAISLTLLIPLMLWYQQDTSWKIIFIPVFLIFNILIGLFIVFFFNALSSRNRDIFHLVPYFMYFGIWFTPVFFNKTILPEKIRFLWYFNPLASIVEGWRWCLFPNWDYDVYFLPALLVIVPLFFIGIFIYKRAEGQFSDFV